MSFWKDITSTKDGDSYDIVRVAMVVVTITLLFSFVWGIFLFSYAFFTGKVFNLRDFFDPVGIFAVSVSAFLMGGSASLRFKSSTEPNGETSYSERIGPDANKQPDPGVNINVTKVG